jgi:hypothetical protein
MNETVEWQIRWEDKQMAGEFKIVGDFLTGLLKNFLANFNKLKAVGSLLLGWAAD